MIPYNVVMYTLSFILSFRVFQRGDFWIGADVLKNDTKLLVNASADIFIGMPKIEIVSNVK
jgi:hypothetical protein